MSDRHAERPERPGRISEIDAERAMMHFAPEVVRSFARLEAAVNQHEQFPRELLANLQTLAAGEKINVHTALTEMLLLGQETMKTGDSKAEAALEELIENLMGMRRDSKPVTILQPVKARGR